MKKVIISILLFSFTFPSYAVYTAPPKDTVVIVGGLGTQADKNTANGGGATKTVWDAGSPSDFIATNGGTITANANAAFDYGNKTITAVGLGTGVTVGTLCYCDDGAAEASFFTGRYEATTVAANVLTFANISLSGVDTDQANGVTCNVGGAIDALQNALDKPVNNGVSYNRYIYTSIATETIGATIDADTYAGGANTSIIVKGANTSCVVDGTRPVITTAASLANGLLAFSNNCDSTQWWYIDFNAGGAGKADYCVRNVAGQTSSIRHIFYDCIMRTAADEDGISILSAEWHLIGCAIYSNGDGVMADGVNINIIGCSVHDNTGDGIKVSSRNRVINNLVYDNGADGIAVDTGGDTSIIVGNTVFGNDSDGMSFAAAGDYCVVTNNTSCGNGTGGAGYGYNLADRGTVLYFGYNHSCDGLGNANDNADGHCNLMSAPTSDSEFADYLEGNNQTGSPTFTNITDGSENFTPTGGNLINNALDAGTS